MSNAHRDLLPYLTPQERAELDAIVAADRTRTVWRPLIDLDDPGRPTPQRMAYDTPADELLYGGGAGGGKSDLLLGTALTAHTRAIIFRRLGTSLDALIERMAEILGHRDGLNLVDKRWRLADRTVWFGSCPNVGDEIKYQGQPHDLKAFDELTQFTEQQYRYLKGWNRTVDPAQRCRVVAATNPPTDAEGEWVIRYWAPWLDDQHTSPARPGELRWFATLDGDDREVESGAPFTHKGETVQPLSRTFIPSLVGDNPYLMSTGYRATLQALPEPLRSQMLAGDWRAGREDDPWQVVPTAWVEAAQQRWQAQPKAAMDALGVDVARGGGDETVLTPRYGDWFGEQITAPGSETPDGPAVVGLVMAHLRDAAPVQIDVIGVGASVFDILRGNGVHTVGLDGRERSTSTDRSGQIKFVNQRAELWWRMREALDPAYGSRLALPPDRRIRADLCAPRWKVTPSGIQVEPKEEIVKRLGRSPDRGESVVYALVETPKRLPRPGGESGQAVTDYDVIGW